MNWLGFAASPATRFVSYKIAMTRTFLLNWTAAVQSGIGVLSSCGGLSVMWRHWEIYGSWRGCCIFFIFFSRRKEVDDRLRKPYN